MPCLGAWERIGETMKSENASMALTLVLLNVALIAAYMRKFNTALVIHFVAGAVLTERLVIFMWGLL